MNCKVSLGNGIVWIYDRHSSQCRDSPYARTAHLLLHFFNGGRKHASRDEIMILVGKGTFRADGWRVCCVDLEFQYLRYLSLKPQGYSQEKAQRSKEAQERQLTCGLRQSCRSGLGCLRLSWSCLDGPGNYDQDWHICCRRGRRRRHRTRELSFMLHHGYGFFDNLSGRDSHALLQSPGIRHLSIDVKFLPLRNVELLLRSVLQVEDQGRGWLHVPYLTGNTLGG